MKTMRSPSFVRDITWGSFHYYFLSFVLRSPRRFMQKSLRSEFFIWWISSRKTIKEVRAIVEIEQWLAGSPCGVVRSAASLVYCQQRAICASNFPNREAQPLPQDAAAAELHATLITHMILSQPSFFFLGFSFKTLCRNFNFNFNSAATRRSFSKLSKCITESRRISSDNITSTI